MFNLKDARTKQALRTLRNQPTWEHLLVQLQQQADATVKVMAHPRKDMPMPLEWYAGRLSAIIEIIDAATSTEVTNG